MVKQFIGYGVFLEDSLDRARNKEIDAINIVLLAFSDFLYSVFGKNLYQRCSNKTWFISSDMEDTLVEWFTNHCPRIYFRIPNEECLAVLLKISEKHGLSVGKDYFTCVKTFSNEKETIRAIVCKPMDEKTMLSLLEEANIEPIKSL